MWAGSWSWSLRYDEKEGEEEKPRKDGFWKLEETELKIRSDMISPGVFRGRLWDFVLRSSDDYILIYLLSSSPHISFRIIATFSA
jgi:hypothetical protein